MSTPDQPPRRSAEPPMIRLAAIAPAPPGQHQAGRPARSSEREQAHLLRYRPRRAVPAGRYRLEIGYPAAGLVDHLLELRLEGGEHRLLRLPVAARNRFDGVIELNAPLGELRLHVSGSGRLARPPSLWLSRWPEQRPVLRQAGRLARALSAKPRGLARWLAAAAWCRWRRPEAGDAGALWRALFDERPARDAALHRARLARLAERPVFAVLAAPGEERAVAAALSAQLYPGWRVFAADGAARAAAEADFVLFHPPGLALGPHALLEYAIAAALCPGVALLYGDHANRTPAGPAPIFKPAWSPALFAACDYPGAGACFSARLLDSAGWGGAPGGLRHRLRQACTTLPAGRVAHVPRLLWLQEDEGEPPCALTSPPPPPSASLIIPTRDRAELLARCLERCRATTRGRAVEIIIIDNGSTEPAALALLEAYRRQPGVSVLRRPGEFNYSALCNAGAAAATGVVLVFVNNDVEPLSEDWLDRLAGLAALPDAGCVGALLLYPDGTVQHAGVVLGIDDRTAHRLRGARPDDPAVARELGLVREVMAVTGACLALRRAVFEAAGGFDPALAVSNNDIDLCLKVAALGHRNLVAPARLLHHESASRGRDASPAQHALAGREHALMQRRWGVPMMTDPYHSPNLSQRGDAMAIRTF